MKKSFILFLSFLQLTLITTAQEKFTGVWKQGDYGYALIPDVDWTKFNSEYTRITNEGKRLTDIETYTRNGKRYYTSVWQTGSGKHACIPAKEWPAFEQEYRRLTGEGYRLTDVETYSEGGKRYYLSVWAPGTDAHAMLPPKEWSAFESEWTRIGKENLRLTDIEIFIENDKRYYIGVWRKGTDAHALLPPKEWTAFESEWKRISGEGLRLDDIEIFNDNGKTYYFSSWRAGSGGHALQNAVDWEAMESHWATYAQGGLRLTDIETYTTSCDNVCMNNVVNGNNSSYDYHITGTSLHCEGKPGSCPSGNTTSVVYRWPTTVIGGKNFVRFSAVNIKDAIFTLPFKVPAADMNGYNGWMYRANEWHLALDYSTGDPLKTFQVVASAKGKVIHMGWDAWSGNSIVISHDVGTKKDVYRTIYMHMRNGPENDCSLSWSKGVPVSGNRKTDYKAYLNSCGCKEDPADRTDLPADKWGTNNQKFDTGLLGKTVEAGDVIGYAGSTGPGGFAGNHLHIFYAHRDPEDDRWYFFDPFGIYSYGSCYPAKVDGTISTPCIRYPVAWKNGKPGYAQ